MFRYFYNSLIILCYFNFQNIIGVNVAVKNVKNNNELDKKFGKKSFERIMPTSKLLEKSGTGNKRNPTINPIIIEMYAVLLRLEPRPL